MGTQKKSVDEIWKELNARVAPRASGIGIPGITSTVKVVAPKASYRAQQVVATGASVEDVPTKDASHPSSDTARRHIQYDAEKAGVSADELQSYVSNIQRLINCLSDPDRSTRRQAITALQTRLMQGEDGTPPPSAPMLQALICGPLLRPLVTMIGDVVEKSRLTSLQLLEHAVKKVADVTCLLPALMPEVVKRMGHVPVVESTEEIRLQLTHLIAALVNRSDASQWLPPYAGDMAMFLCRALEDGYHEIKKGACGCVKGLAAALPASTMAPHCEKLLQALLANLAHQHSRVRLACIEAIDALISAGVPAGLVDSLVAAGIRPIAYDRASNVRETLFNAVAHWLGHQPSTPAPASGTEPAAAAVGGVPARNTSLHAVVGENAAHVYAPSLLPLLLLGVTDSQPSIAKLALDLIEQVGDIWVSRLPSDKQDKQPTGVQTLPSAEPMLVDAGLVGSVGPAATAASAEPTDAEMQDASMSAAAAAAAAAAPPPPPLAGPSGRDAAAAHAAVAASQLGPPYQGRPRPGARRMAQELLPQLLPPMLRELGEWTIVLRACATRQLHTLLVLAEDAATAELPKLLPALCTAIGDDNVEVAGHILASVHVLGAHVASQLWLPLMLDQLSNAKLSLVQKANTLVVLSGLLHTAGRAQAAVPQQLLAGLAAALTADDMRTSEHPAVRQQLLAVALNMMRWLKSRCSQISLELYMLLLQLYGFEHDPARLQAIQSAMQELAGCCGYASADGLADQHADRLLDLVLVDPTKWNAESPSYLVFRALLLAAGPATLTRLVPRTTHALRPVLEDADADAALRLGLLQLLDMLLEDASRCQSFGGPHAAATLTNVLLPPLVWRAGKTAAAVRFAAITALATFLRQRLSPPEALLPLVNNNTLLPLLYQSLDEDWYPDVRHTACYLMEQLLATLGLQLSAEQRRAVYIELLKRLDDSSNQVRIAACHTLVAFASTLPRDYCNTNTGYLAQGVVIHMDDSDMAVQEAACSVLEALAAVKPTVVAAEVSKVRDRFRSKHYCDRVLAACSC